VGLNRYFMRANTNEPKTLTAENIRCSIENKEVTIRIAKIEGG